MTMKKKTENRGQIIYIGKHGKSYYDSIKGMKRRFYFLIFILLFTISMEILAIMGYFAQPVIWILIFFIIFFMVAISGWGLEIDAIYENGITNCITPLHEYLKGKSFHPFENITKIGYGYNQRRGSKFIVLYECHSLSPTVRNFTEIEYKNDFYQRLIETLKKKCPNAKWKKVVWDELPTWNK
jgi:hypothetical protein